MVKRKHNELVAREGWPFVLPPLVLAILAVALQWPIWVVISALVLTAYVAYFFRNPYRQVPTDPEAVLSPADGKIVHVGRDDDNRWVVSIFLNIFNVHINRSPVEGFIESVNYTKGKFLAAYDPKASLENERNALTIRRGEESIIVTQIAGLIARRIVCWSTQGDSITRGERFGLIRFGSRVDLVLPSRCEIAVAIGQKVRGGSDVIAKLSRPGEES